MRAPSRWWWYITRIALLLFAPWYRYVAVRALWFCCRAYDVVAPYKTPTTAAWCHGLRARAYDKHDGTQWHIVFLVMSICFCCRFRALLPGIDDDYVYLCVRWFCRVKMMSVCLSDTSVCFWCCAVIYSDDMYIRCYSYTVFASKQCCFYCFSFVFARAWRILYNAPRVIAQKHSANYCFWYWWCRALLKWYYYILLMMLWLTPPPCRINAPRKYDDDVSRIWSRRRRRLFFSLMRRARAAPARARCVMTPLVIMMIWY